LLKIRRGGIATQATREKTKFRKTERRGGISSAAGKKAKRELNEKRKLRGREPARRKNRRLSKKRLRLCAKRKGQQSAHKRKKKRGNQALRHLASLWTAVHCVQEKEKKKATTGICDHVAKKEGALTRHPFAPVRRKGERRGVRRREGTRRLSPAFRKKAELQGSWCIGENQPPQFGHRMSPKLTQRRRRRARFPFFPGGKSW